MSVNFKNGPTLEYLISVNSIIYFLTVLQKTAAKCGCIFNNYDLRLYIEFFCWTFKYSDSYNLVCHSRAMRQGVAAVGRPEISALLFAKAVSAVNRRGAKEEQVFGLQPQDRQHDSSGQEHEEYTTFLSVCLLGETHSGVATCYRLTE